MKLIDNVKYFGILILLLFVGCKKTPLGSGNDTDISVVNVAAAANLREVLQEMKKQYEVEHPDQRIEITFGSSGLLAQQILNGAPFDLFLSADTSFPEKLEKSDKTAAESSIYAYGKVALWSSQYDVSKGLELVLDPQVKKIAVANPQLAPYGKNTVKALQEAGLYSTIETKIVWAENINQAAQFAATGNADLGFIALSNALNKDMKAKGRYYELSDKECQPIAQSGVVLKGSNKASAQDFFVFIRNEKMRDLWKQYGYLIPLNP